MVFGAFLEVVEISIVDEGNGVLAFCGLLLLVVAAVISSFEPGAPIIGWGPSGLNTIPETNDQNPMMCQQSAPQRKDSVPVVTSVRVDQVRDRDVWLASFRLPYGLRACANLGPMGVDGCSSFLFCGISCDEPASTSIGKCCSGLAGWEPALSFSSSF
mgnify:CR=1 FL=1